MCNIETILPLFGYCCCSFLWMCVCFFFTLGKKNVVFSTEFHNFTMFNSLLHNFTRIQNACVCQWDFLFCFFFFFSIFNVIGSRCQGLNTEFIRVKKKINKNRERKIRILFENQVFCYPSSSSSLLRPLLHCCLWY